MIRPIPISICATIRSFVFLVDSEVNIIPGVITQIKTPIVDPTKPSTTSIFGITNPTTNDDVTITKVIH
uniref:Putative secreted protein n=1 Tax=Panstrongylus lignarius TaxID=156445 RepID=A0A224Y1D0_9HEMI